jgi:DNA polymerase I-like protein with 3'-5' exonuclease and polymerase domains
MSFDSVMRSMPGTYSSVIGYPYWFPYVHGSAVSCRYIKLAMVEADKLMRSSGRSDDVRLLMQVHDELVFEIPATGAESIARELRSVMESVAPTKELNDVPILAEIAIGKDWGEMKRVSA